MIALGHEAAAAFMRRHLDTEQYVLVEKVLPYHYGEGFTPQYLRARVELKGKGRHWRGKLIKVKLKRIEKEEQIIWGTPLRQT